MVSVEVRKVSFTRVPLRLGEDVFETGRISNKKARNSGEGDAGFLVFDGCVWDRMVSGLWDQRHARSKKC